MRDPLCGLCGSGYESVCSALCSSTTRSSYSWLWVGGPPFREFSKDDSGLAMASRILLGKLVHKLELAVVAVKAAHIGLIRVQLEGR